MDTIVTVLAWIQVVLTAMVLLAEPVRAAASDEPFKASEYIARLLGVALSVTLAGRCLGWW